jgi:hypothetical protein
MYSIFYFKESYAPYENLKYEVVVGCIQLLMDSGEISLSTRNGLYLGFRDFRQYGNDFYIKIVTKDLPNFIDWLEYKGHVDISNLQKAPDL